MDFKMGMLVMVVGMIVLGIVANNVSASCQSIIKGVGTNLNDYKIFGECEVTSSYWTQDYTQIEAAASYYTYTYPFVEYDHSKEPTPRTYCYAWAYSYAYLFDGGADTRADTSC